jgi:glycosyltransferase involved in cell wall biosynthesis
MSSSDVTKKVAIVYDRVNKWGGAERVLLTLHEIFPDAPLYTSVYDSKGAPWAKVFPKVYSSWLQKIPFLNKKHELLGSLTPLAFERLNLNKYDVVISVTSESAKGIIVGPNTKHICYCLTPTRYLWNDYDFYLNNPQKPLSYIPFYKILARPILGYAKYWDKVASKRPDRIIAISTEVKERIKRYYQRDSDIIFPPVEIKKFQNTKYKKQTNLNNYYLMVTRLVPYKKVALAIKAFNTTGEKLVIVGSGSEENDLKLLAKKNIIFVKNLTDRELGLYYHNARAFIMPQNEDFGIAAVEAQSLGVPVIAYQAGGVLDIIIDRKTGIFFKKQTVRCLIEAIKLSKKIKFNKEAISKHANRFSKTVFKEKIRKLVDNV